MKTIYSVEGISIGKELRTTHRTKLKTAYESALSGVELTDGQRKALNTYVMSMTEKSAKEHLNAMPGSDISSLLEILEMMEDDPEFEVFMINGNNFAVEKGLDVRTFAKKLNEYGRVKKGNTWSVYLDEEGELIVY